MSSFKGPVFIVGVPRSGTKLLRDLLNRNPRISIPEAETHFIPYFIRKYGVPPPFLDEGESFERFCGELRQSTFSRYMQERGYSFNSETLAQAADLQAWSSIFEQVLRSFGRESEDSSIIFGDKTPEYVKAMGLLKRVFPAGRFVHIIRDPRDCSLSAWRSWRLHPYGMAERWRRTLQSQREVGKAIGDYLELRYEELIMEPEKTLRSVCEFLECDFVPEMLSLARSNEKAGDARGRTEILIGNMNKFWEGFSERQIRRIEEIAFDQMLDVGYEVCLAEKSKPLHAVVGFALRRRDAVAFLRWKAESQGLMETATYLWRRNTRRF